VAEKKNFKKYDNHTKVDLHKSAVNIPLKSWIENETDKPKNVLPSNETVNTTTPKQAISKSQPSSK